MGPAIEIQDLRFAYRAGSPVLDIPRMELEREARTFLFGPSGSGKTTLLGVLAGVLQADAGSVRVLGTELTALSGASRDAFRASHIGYVFQMFNLIPYLTVLENITLPCRMDRTRRARLNGSGPEETARTLAAHLGIDQVLGSSVTELSVGQQQRVAAARALIGGPSLVIADEPTSALDTDRREAFVRLLFQECADAGAGLVLVSHDRGLAPLFDRVVHLPAVNRAAGG